MEIKLTGQLMEIKHTAKNNKPYLVLYSDGVLLRIFIGENESIEKYAQHLGKTITLPVLVYEPKFIRVK